MTPREKRIVWAIAQGIEAAQEMEPDERQQAVRQAFNGAMHSMRDYACVAMCLLLGAASAPADEQGTN